MLCAYKCGNNGEGVDDDSVCKRGRGQTVGGIIDVEKSGGQVENNDKSNGRRKSCLDGVYSNARFGSCRSTGWGQSVAGSM